MDDLDEAAWAALEQIESEAYRSSSSSHAHSNNTTARPSSIQSNATSNHNASHPTTASRNSNASNWDDKSSNRRFAVGASSNNGNTNNFNSNHNAHNNEGGQRSLLFQPVPKSSPSLSRAQPPPSTTASPRPSLTSLATIPAPSLASNPTSSSSNGGRISMFSRTSSQTSLNNPARTSSTSTSTNTTAAGRGALSPGSVQQAGGTMNPSTFLLRTPASSSSSARGRGTQQQVLVGQQGRGSSLGSASGSTSGGRGRGRGAPIADDEDDNVDSTNAGRGRGRGGRGAAARGRGRGRGRGAAGVGNAAAGGTGRGRGRGRGRGASANGDDGVRDAWPDADAEMDEALAAEEPEQGDDEVPRQPAAGRGSKANALPLETVFNFPDPADDSPPLIDLDAASTWIYPSNYPRRDYQFSITRQALFNNTLVSLPTGLGKTFIAAVLMYNFYRWFPNGKVVFMAPTKPLVMQQIKACYQIMGLPRSDTVTMTGAIAPSLRRDYWTNKRVFFITPQILTNDISRGTCDARSIVCLVVDEAHRAQGNYAYCTVVKSSVMTNLLISHIEVRTSEDIDVRPYIHSTQLEMIKLPLTPEMHAVRSLFLELLRIPVIKLCDLHAFWQQDPEKVSQFVLVTAKQKFEANPPRTVPPNAYGQVRSMFALGITLYHAWGVLNSHGFRSLRLYLKDLADNVENGKETSHAKKSLVSMAHYKNLCMMLEELTDKDFNHPKLEKMLELVVEHFQKHHDGDTRVIIFAQFRDSVDEIVDLLKPHAPVIKAMPFVGQTSGRSNSGLTQKQQARVIQEFKAGGYNTLVATSIGEEGLDIGEVDLIICFDAQASPIRMVQRMGRTGRKRDGRCVVLVTEGPEEEVFKKSQSKGKSITRNIMRPESLTLYDTCPRMVPHEIKPKVIFQHMNIGQVADEDEPTSSKRKRKASDAAFEDEQEAEEEEETEGISKPKPRRKTSAESEDDRLLSVDEERWLRTNYALPPSERPRSLSVDAQVEEQATPSPISEISHSSRSRLLIRAVGFIERGLSQSDDGGEAYAAEMERNLDTEDVGEFRVAVERPRKPAVTRHAGIVTKEKQLAKAAPPKAKKTRTSANDLADASSEGQEPLDDNQILEEWNVILPEEDDNSVGHHQERRVTNSGYVTKSREESPSETDEQRKKEIMKASSVSAAEKLQMFKNKFRRKSTSADPPAPTGDAGDQYEQEQRHDDQHEEVDEREAEAVKNKEEEETFKRPVQKKAQRTERDEPREPPQRMAETNAKKADKSGSTVGKSKPQPPDSMRTAASSSSHSSSTSAIGDGPHARKTPVTDIRKSTEQRSVPERTSVSTTAGAPLAIPEELEALYDPKSSLPKEMKNLRALMPTYLIVPRPPKSNIVPPAPTFGAPRKTAVREALRPMLRQTELSHRGPAASATTATSTSASSAAAEPASTTATAKPAPQGRAAPVAALAKTAVSEHAARPAAPPVQAETEKAKPTASLSAITASRPKSPALPTSAEKEPFVQQAAQPLKPHPSTEIQQPPITTTTTAASSMVQASAASSSASTSASAAPAPASSIPPSTRSRLSLRKKPTAPPTATNNASNPSGTATTNQAQSLSDISTKPVLSNTSVVISSVPPSMQTKPASLSDISHGQPSSRQLISPGMPASSATIDTTKPAPSAIKSTSTSGDSKSVSEGPPDAAGSPNTSDLVLAAQSVNEPIAAKSRKRLRKNSERKEAKDKDEVTTIVLEDEEDEATTMRTKGKQKAVNKKRLQRAAFIDDEAEVEDGDEVSEDEQEEDEEDGDTSFIANSPDESTDINMYRRSLLSQESQRPAKFRTPVRRVPNQYKMRFVENSKERPSIPVFLLDQSPYSTSVASSSPDSSPSVTTSIEETFAHDGQDEEEAEEGEEPLKQNRGESPAPQKATGSVQPRKLQFDEVSTEIADEDELKLYEEVARIEQAVSSGYFQPQQSAVPDLPPLPAFFGARRGKTSPSSGVSNPTKRIGSGPAAAPATSSAAPQQQPPAASQVAVPNFGLGDLSFDDTSLPASPASPEQGRLLQSHHDAASCSGTSSSSSSSSSSHVLVFATPSSPAPPNSKGKALSPAVVIDLSLSPSPQPHSLPRQPTATTSHHSTPPPSPFYADPDSPSRLPPHLLQAPPPSTPERNAQLLSAPPTVVVSSMQLNRSQVPHILQTKYRAETIVCSLPTFDFIVSTLRGGLAVMRKPQHEMVDADFRERITAALVEARRIFLRVVMIIEQDERSAIGAIGRQYDDSLQFLVQSARDEESLTLLFSDSALHSAQIIADLAREEAVAGGALTGLTSALLERNEKKARFLQAIPGIGIVAAALLLTRFSNLAAIARSSENDLVRAGLRPEVAASIYRHFASFVPDADDADTATS